jgi:hypothetical protein
MKLSKLWKSTDPSADLRHAMNSVSSLDENQLYGLYVVSAWLAQVFGTIMKFWSLGYVHTRFIALGARFTVVWNDDLIKGVAEYDPEIRGFADGMKDSSIRVGADKAPSAVVDDLEYCVKADVDARGYSLLVSSMTQCLVLFVRHLTTSTPISAQLSHLFSMKILTMFTDYMRNETEHQQFLARLEGYQFDDLFNDTQTAAHSDVLQTSSFVYLVERFLLSSSLIRDRKALRERIHQLDARRRDEG